MEPEHATHTVDAAFPFELELDSCCANAMPTKQRHARARESGAACFCRMCTGGPYDFYEDRVVVNGGDDCPHCGYAITIDCNTNSKPAFVDWLCPGCRRAADARRVVCAYCWGKLDARRRCLGNRHWPGF